MRIVTPSGKIVNTDKRLWAQDLSETDYQHCEAEPSLERWCPSDCRCSICIQEDSDMIEKYERSQTFRNGC